MKFRLSPSNGMAKHIICVAIWEISTISPTFWLIGNKSNGIFQNFIIFLIKSTVGPALCIKLCLMYGQMENF